jgi:hypothetical protein
LAVTYPVRLHEGPCDGQTKRLTVAQIKQGTTTCKGATYQNPNPFASVRGPQDFYYQVPAKQPPAKGGNQNVAGAWTRWMHALGRTGPASHRRIVNSTHRARRIGRKRGRA